MLVLSLERAASRITYACAHVSKYRIIIFFTCTNLLGALLGAAGSNVGVRHGDV
jgi:hypothetical protein